MHDEGMELLEAMALGEMSIDASRLTLNGTAYASLIPEQGSTNRLLSVVVNSKPPFDPKALREYPHVTLVYSRGADIDIIEDIDLRALAVEYPNVRARVVGVEYWEGHDKDGYAVAKLESPDASDISGILQLAGAEHSFDEYQPHMTICGKVGPLTPEVTAWIEHINKVLASEKIELTFDKMVIEDARKG